MFVVDFDREIWLCHINDTIIVLFFFLYACLFYLISFINFIGIVLVKYMLNIYLDLLLHFFYLFL